MSGKKINLGLPPLKALEKTDVAKMRAPSFLTVLTALGSNFAFKRDDGVHVIPIGCLSR